MSSPIDGIQVPKALVAILVVNISMSARPVSAQIWIGPGSNWNTAAHWSTGVVPNSPTAVVDFTGIALGNVNISSSVQSQSLNFSNPTGSYTLSSSAGVILSGVTAINVAAGVTNPQFIQISPNSGGSLLFPSGNNLTLTNNSTAPGMTLLIGQLTVIGTPGSGGVIVNGTGTTEIEGTFASQASGNHIVNGLTKNGTGTLILSNPNNYYTGGTRINSGVVSVPTIANGGLVSPIGADSIDPANLVIGSSSIRGTLQFTGTNSFYSTNRGLTVGGLYSFLGGGGISVQNAATLLSVGGQITGTGSLIKSGPGALGLVNTTNNYTGGTYVEAGTLVIATSGAVLPPGRDVNVFSGASLELAFSSGGNVGNPIGTLNLDGGTFRVVSGGPSMFLNRLTMGLSGGTVNLSGTNGAVRLTGVGSGITVNGNSTWIGGAGFPSGIVFEAGLNTECFIAPGVTLTNSALLYNDFRITGGGTLYMIAPVNNIVVYYTVRQGKLRVDNLPVGSSGPSVLGNMQFGTLNLDGGTLQYSGPTASSAIPIALSPIGGVVEVSNTATTLTLTGQIGPPTGSTAGPLVKTGLGTLILNSAGNLYFGGITVSGGRLDVANDAQLGAANPIVNPFGTLRYTANSTTSRSFTLNSGTIEVPTGVTLNLNGAAVGGGFLRGLGTYNLTGSTSLTGATTFNTTTMNVTGPASISNFANNGALTVNSGQTLAMNYATNGTAGVMTINGTANVSNYSTYGRLAINPGGTVNNTQSTMTFGGGSVSTIGIYNPATGQVTPGGTLNIGPGDLRVQGGFVRNNGVITGSGNLIIDYLGLVRGAGEIDLPNAPIRINGGQLLAGNSPGLTRVTNFSLVATGVTGGDFSNATGIAGPPIGSTGTQLSGWSVFEYGNSTNDGGSAQVQGTPANKAIWQFQTVLDSGNYSTPGPPANFSAAQPYVWQIVWPRSAADVGNPNNITPINTVALISILDTATMQNVPLTNENLNAYLRFDDSAWNWGGVPVNERGSFAFVFLPDALGAPNRVIALTYTPVPEPVWLLSAVAAAFVGIHARRRVLKNRAAEPICRKSVLPPAGRSEM